jgi:hypothetical protein
MRYLSPDDYQFRKQIRMLIAFLYHIGCTTILTFEEFEHDREASVALAVDGVIRLTRGVSKRRVIGLRSLEVEKLRGSDFMTGYHSMRISPVGVRVFPHRVEDPGNHDLTGDRLCMGYRESRQATRGRNRKRARRPSCPGRAASERVRCPWPSQSMECEMANARWSMPSKSRRVQSSRGARAWGSTSTLTRKWDSPYRAHQSDRTLSRRVPAYVADRRRRG